MIWLSSTSGPETEDYLSFSSTILGAVGSTLQQNGSSQTLLLGLVVAAIAKALPSLADPKKSGLWERVEDSLLFLSAVLGYVAAGIESNFDYSTPLSREIVIIGLAVGLIAKTIPSLISHKKLTLEDSIPHIAGVTSLIGGLLGGTQLAAAGLFLGFLWKAARLFGCR